LKKKICIGILGGGQLARMSAFQAIRMGFDVAILEKTINSPAGSLTRNEIVGWVDDESCLDSISSVSDIVTLENEFIDYKFLEYIEKLNKKVIPSSYTISLIQDKLIQKQQLSKAGIPVPKFTVVDEYTDYAALSASLGKKFILKSRKMGYDGYGNFTVSDENEYKKGIEKLSKRESLLMAEEFIDYSMELAVMAVRTTKESKCYPVVQTIQENHICKMVLAPAQIDSKLAGEAKEIAFECIKAVEGLGLYGIEMFLTKDNRLLVNEMAPRPHNSGHYTIEACVTSQYENHIRSILDLPLGSTEMVKNAAVMVNILGTTDGPGVLEDYGAVLANANAHLHIYGKEKSRVGRKMGHITLVGEDMSKLVAEANELIKKTII
jgi:5-(carboxyamino)imidazole ribonucleotide synthase